MFDIRPEPNSANLFMLVWVDEGNEEIVDRYLLLHEAKAMKDDFLQSMVEQAERAAGWDPHP